MFQAEESAEECSKPAQVTQGTDQLSYRNHATWGIALRAGTPCPRSVPGFAEACGQVASKDVHIISAS